jgi:hypothetical protein
LLKTVQRSIPSEESLEAMLRTQPSIPEYEDQSRRRLEIAMAGYMEASLLPVIERHHGLAELMLAMVCHAH